MKFLTHIINAILATLNLGYFASGVLSMIDGDHSKLNCFITAGSLTAGIYCLALIIKHDFETAE